MKKPTISEIAAYCTSRNNNIDAEAFWHHYESNGWQVGKSLMKNWKSAVITWEKRSPKPKEINRPPVKPKRIPRKETPQERELINKMKALTKPPYNWRNRAEVNKMTIEMKKLQKQYNDLRSAPQKLEDLLEDIKLKTCESPALWGKKK